MKGGHDGSSVEGEVYQRGEGEQRHLGEPRVNMTLSQAVGGEGREESLETSRPRG